MPSSDDDLDSAVQRFWGECDPPGGLVTKWFLVTEGIREDGGRYLDYVWTEDMKTWDVRGMLHEALDSQFAGSLATEVFAEDEGDDA